MYLYTAIGIKTQELASNPNQNSKEVTANVLVRLSPNISWSSDLLNELHLWIAGYRASLSKLGIAKKALPSIFPARPCHWASTLHERIGPIAQWILPPKTKNFVVDINQAPLSVQGKLMFDWARVWWTSGECWLGVLTDSWVFVLFPVSRCTPLPHYYLCEAPQPTRSVLLPGRYGYHPDRIQGDINIIPGCGWLYVVDCMGITTLWRYDGTLIHPRSRL